ncbi:hypothetical protein C6502_12755 [Candidatus Poribacteria bacterium]|nr:MAG: hypothetical protein C6502_12755 [Candidatus Poribacteria bacterium]
MSSASLEVVPTKPNDIGSNTLLAIQPPKEFMMKNPGIYILTSPSGKQYVGKDRNLPRRANEHLRGGDTKCPAIHKAILKYGHDAFSVEIIRYPGISEETLDAVERWWIKRLQTLSPNGYNLTNGGDGGKLSKKTRQKMSERNRKRVENGTHNFLGGSIQRHTNKKRVEEGTHPWLGPETNQKMWNDPEHRKKISHAIREHNKDPQVRKKKSQRNREQIKAGTHNFCNAEVRQEALNARRRKKQKAEWMWTHSIAMFLYEIHDYTLKRRAEFLSKDIPDTSNAEQTYFF